MWCANTSQRVYSKPKRRETIPFRIHFFLHGRTARTTIFEDRVCRESVEAENVRKLYNRMPSVPCNGAYAMQKVFCGSSFHCFSVSLSLPRHSWSRRCYLTCFISDSDFIVSIPIYYLLPIFCFLSLRLPFRALEISLFIRTRVHRTLLASDRLFRPLEARPPFIHCGDERWREEKMKYTKFMQYRWRRKRRKRSEKQNETNRLKIFAATSKTNDEDDDVEWWSRRERREMSFEYENTLRWKDERQPRDIQNTIYCSLNYHLLCARGGRPCPFVSAHGSFRIGFACVRKI